MQHLAKAVNIAFQTDFGENYLESVYQAAVVRNGEIQIIHKEYFGFRDTWFGQFGRLLRSLQLTLEGPDPISPEGQRRIAEKGPSSIRGILSLIGRKLELVTEYEDRVPAYVEQMFDRLEGLGDHRGLGSRRLGDPNHPREPRYPDLPRVRHQPERPCGSFFPVADADRRGGAGGTSQSQSPARALIRAAAVLASGVPGKSFTTSR